MRVEDFDAMLKSVAAVMSAPDYFPPIMPENDLHPDPARLAAEIVSLRYRMTALEKRIDDITGKPHVNVTEFPRR